MTDVASLYEGIYRIDDEGPVLTGVKCSKCGHVSFPPSESCVECGSNRFSIVDIGNHGTLLCETTVHMKSDKYPAGFSVGYVTMPNGLRVFGQIRKTGPAELPSGAPMKVELATLWQEADKGIQCFRFYSALDEKAS